jgi:DNA-directed RNA polymerase specialized sigma54-like protein
MKPRLVLRQTQKLALTPVVRMSLSILRMAPPS